MDAQKEKKMLLNGDSDPDHAHLDRVRNKIDGLVQDCSNSIVIALGLLQSWAKLSTNDICNVTISFYFIFISNIFIQDKPFSKLFVHGALLQSKTIWIQKNTIT